MITDNDPASVHTGPESRMRALVVCTANLCRSPMVEVLLRDALTRRGIHWSVTSAGTRAAAGQSAHPLTQRVLAEQDFTLAGWRTTLLTEELVDRSDLVITASEEHRTWVLELNPAAMGRVFPLLQLAHILSSAGGRDSIAPDPSIIDWLGGARTRVQPVPPGSVDLADPMGRSVRHFRRCARTVEEAVRQIVTPLTPARSAM